MCRLCHTLYMDEINLLGQEVTTLQTLDGSGDDFSASDFGMVEQVELNIAPSRGFNPGGFKP